MVRGTGTKMICISPENDIEKEEGGEKEKKGKGWRGDRKEGRKIRKMKRTMG